MMKQDIELIMRIQEILNGIKVDPETRYSQISIDNWTTRQEIDKEMKTIENSTKKFTKTTMDPTTPLMDLGRKH